VLNLSQFDKDYDDILVDIEVLVTESKHTPAESV
jgi:hypothetical protein